MVRWMAKLNGFVDDWCLIFYSHYTSFVYITCNLMLVWHFELMLSIKPTLLDQNQLLFKLIIPTLGKVRANKPPRKLELFFHNIYELLFFLLVFLNLRHHPLLICFLYWATFFTVLILIWHSSVFILSVRGLKSFLLHDIYELTFFFLVFWI